MNCYALAKQVAEKLTQHNQKISSAESCTGGLLARTATTIVGASHWFHSSFVTYCDDSKIQALGVNPETIKRYTAVSRETVAEMSAGVLLKTPVDYALALTGVAGPHGGTEITPVGEVFIAIQKKEKSPKIYHLQIRLDRHLLQYYVTGFAFSRLLDQL